MTGCKSIRNITSTLLSINKDAYHLGIIVDVDSFSLFKANESREYRIFKDLSMAHS